MHVAVKLLFLAALASCTLRANAQGNYEIQIYGSETVGPKSLMVEVHSNFTPKGQTQTLDRVYPTNHQEHETLELTAGIKSWAEVGFYVFTSEQAGYGTQWVGDHIRPRVRAPDSWKLPVGLSLSTEVGYQRAVYSPDTWTLEIRPIIDKTDGRFYWAFNPVLDRTFHGPGVAQGLDFQPAVKAGWDFTRRVNAGVEYYADYGRLGSPYALHDQLQDIFAVTDLNLSAQWEFNFGIGVGATASTDHLILKAIVGRRFSFGRQKPEGKAGEDRPQNPTPEKPR